VLDATLSAIGERVRVHAGLRPPPWVLTTRVRERTRALGVTPGDYLLRLDGPELDALVEALRVGETRFFRQKRHVAMLRRVVVPALAEARAAARWVRAWSAGCATGEEAYTLAILLAEGLPGFDVDVLGTDISDEALARARAGVYPEAALQPVPPAERARWFRPVEPGLVAVAPELRARVRFERKNLVEPFGGDKDVILCRNVLIYFDAEARAATAQRLVRALAPRGFLFLGYAETLRPASGVEVLRSEDGLVYRRLAAAAEIDARPSSPPLEGRATGPLTARRPGERTMTERSINVRPVEARSTSVRPLNMRSLSVRPSTERSPSKRLFSNALPSERSVDGSPASVGVIRIVGSHEAPDRVAAELRAAMAGGATALLVDLDGAEFLDDSVAPVLRRAAAAAAASGVGFTLAARRPGPRRWLARHGLLGADRGGEEP